MHSHGENWVYGGENLVIRFSLPSLDTNIVAGCDVAIQDRITNLLSTDNDFCDKCQTLLGGDTINIEIQTDMSYESCVIVRPPLQIMADGS
jgi:hypothetical protein